jgi:hypothetical protein
MQPRPSPAHVLQASQHSGTPRRSMQAARPSAHTQAPSRQYSAAAELQHPGPHFSVPAGQVQTPATQRAGFWQR